MKATVDRIENDYAVLLVKTTDLPKEVQEGTLLQISVELDKAGTKKRRTSMKKLITDLFT